MVSTGPEFIHAPYIGHRRRTVAPPPKAIVDRIAQIEHEITTEHWERLTATRPINLP